MATTKSLIDTYLEHALANAKREDLISVGYTNDKGTIGISQSMYSMLFSVISNLLATISLAFAPVLAVGVIALTTHFLPAIITHHLLWSSFFALMVFSLALLVGVYVTTRNVVLLSRRLRGVPLYPRLKARSEVFLAPSPNDYIYALINNLLALLILIILALPFDVSFTWLTWILALIPVGFAVVFTISSSLIRGLFVMGGSTFEYQLPLPASARSEQFDERVARLQQMREWLRDDRLRELVDDAIGQQVKLVARRQLLLSVILSIISLVVGWLLSAISPSIIGKLF